MIPLISYYIHSNDTWYFPHKQIQIKRMLFAQEYIHYLSHILDYELNDAALKMLSEQPDVAAINVTDYID